MRGGSRPGSGRPVTNPTKSVSTRLNDGQRAELKRRGGAPAIKAWLGQLHKTTSTNGSDFSADEVADYRKYEAVRSAGVFNMFKQSVPGATGLSDPQYFFVIQKFVALCARRQLS